MEERNEPGIFIPVLHGRRTCIGTVMAKNLRAGDRNLRYFLTMNFSQLMLMVFLRQQGVRPGVLFHRMAILGSLKHQLLKG